MEELKMNVLKEIINSINEKISDRLMYKNEKVKGSVQCRSLGKSAHFTVVTHFK